MAITDDLTPAQAVEKLHKEFEDFIAKSDADFVVEELLDTLERVIREGNYETGLIDLIEEERLKLLSGELGTKAVWQFADEIREQIQHGTVYDWYQVGCPIVYTHAKPDEIPARRAKLLEDIAKLK
jgi:hypothetical protein